MNSTFIIPVVEVKLEGIEAPLYVADSVTVLHELFVQLETTTVSMPISVLKSEKNIVTVRAPLGLIIQ